MHHDDQLTGHSDSNSLQVVFRVTKTMQRTTSPPAGYMAVSGDDVEATNQKAALGDEPDASTTDEEDWTREHFFTDLPAGTATVKKTIFNFTSFLLSGSFLALPYALSTGGLAMLPAFVLLPSVDFYTGKILIECLYEKDPLLGNKVRARSTYREIGIASFSKFGGLWVDVLVYVSLVTNQMNSFILGGALLSILVNVIPRRISILIVAFVMFPTSLLKDLANIAWLSLASFSAVLLTISTLGVFSLVHYRDWKTSEFFILGTTQEMISAFAIVFFCFEAHTVLPDIEESMIDKSQMNRSILTTYATSATLTIFFVLLAFLAFGKETQGTIVPNLPPGPLSTAVCILLILAVILSFPVAFHATMHSVQHSAAFHSKSPTRVWFLAVRIATFSIIVLVSVLLPYFAKVTALSGSLASPHTALICPCAFHLKLKSKESGWLQILLNVFLIVFGITSQVAMLYFSVRTLLGL